MPRLIDADAFFEKFAEIRDYEYASQEYEVDAVEVVRCRECKWFDLTHPYGTVIPDAYHCKANDRFYSAEHFCAYGERKE